MVDVLDGFEPGHLWVVDVVGFIVEDSEFLDLPDDFAEVCLGVGGLAHRSWAEWRQEVVAQIFVFERGILNIAKKDAVDVGKKEIACLTDDADLVLNVEGKLEVIPPIAAIAAVIRENWIVEENLEAVEVGPQT